MAEAPELLKKEQVPQEVAPDSVSRAEEKETAPEVGRLEVAEQQPSPEDQQRAEQLAQQAEQLAPSVQPEPVQVKDPVVVDLENLLSEDLGDIYMGLSEKKKQAFREKGEAVAVAIKEMVTSGKVRVKKILDLIRDWLRIIPGVNKFFLEQEAKIKADSIISYIEANHSAKNDL